MQSKVIPKERSKPCKGMNNINPFLLKTAPCGMLKMTREKKNKNKRENWDNSGGLEVCYRKKKRDMLKERIKGLRMEVEEKKCIIKKLCTQLKRVNTSNKELCKFVSKYGEQLGECAVCNARINSFPPSKSPTPFPDTEVLTSIFYTGQGGKGRRSISSISNAEYSQGGINSNSQHQTNPINTTLNMNKTFTQWDAIIHKIHHKNNTLTQLQNKIIIEN